VAENADRFSYRSNDPNQYSPSFYHFRPNKSSVSRPGGSIRKESRPDSPFYKAGNSYTGNNCFIAAACRPAAHNKICTFLGFHRPLRVVPPTASPHSPQPPSYTARTPYFPSHFYPDKLHHYWQYYSPSQYQYPSRLPGNHNLCKTNYAYLKNL
jgi:hypothetical protein